MHKEFGILNSYTLEASFCGPTQGTFKDAHFTQKHLLDMGKTFGRTLQAMSDTSIYSNALAQVEEKMRGIAAYNGGIYNTSSNLMATTATSSTGPINNTTFKSTNYSM